jgi:hypothetical protein
VSLFLGACGGSSGTAENYPLVTPPVQAAAPKGLQPATSISLSGLFEHPGGGVHAFTALDNANFKSRFFTNGPTYLWGILSGIDSRISGLNSQSSSSKAACLTQAPVATTMKMAGQTITLQLQCYQQIGGSVSQDPGLVEWGQDSSGVFYLYTAIGAGWQAAIATPLTGSAATSGTAGTSASTKYSVVGWMSVGVLNGIANPSANNCTTGGWDGCSYAVMEVSGNPSKPVFEMAAAGVGVGFAGAQYISDGTNIFGIGDDGGEGGGSAATICVQASDGTTAVTGTCSVSQSNFSLVPLGMEAVAAGVGVTNTSAMPASVYPGGSSNNVVLNGTATDDVHFGPTAPSTGVGKFQ